MSFKRRTVLSVLAASTAGCGYRNSEQQLTQDQNNEYQVTQNKISNLTELKKYWTEIGEILPTDYNYPTVLHAEAVLDNPIDNWYVYAAPYDTEHIYLLSAPHIEGPYTNQGPVITAEETGAQADAPHVVYDSDSSEIKLWYHETGSLGNSQQFTMLATSQDRGDGSNFTKYGNPTPILDGRESGRWDGDERAYMNCVQIENQFVGVYQGRDVTGSERGIGLCWSSDGINWETASYPFGWGNVLSNFDPDPDPESPNLVAPTIFRIGDKLIVLFGDRGTESNVIYGYPLDRYSDGNLFNRVTVMTFSGQKQGAMMDSKRVGNRLYVFYNDSIGYFNLESY